MKRPYQYITTIFLIFILLYGSNLANIQQFSKATEISSLTTFKDLYLLRVEHYIYLKANDNSPSFNLSFAFPADYQHQTPLYLEFFNDTSEKILKTEIKNDKLSPNKLLNITIAPLSKNQIILLHFNCWVFINSHNYDYLPDHVTIPKKISDLPKKTHKWLESTEVTQTNNILIRHKARQMSRLTTNVITLANRITNYIKYHRYLLFILQLNLGLFFNQDAITTLLINGENVGRSHLGCALFRANTIPARVILCLPDQTFWTQMHYIIEYYVPQYGWVLLDTTRAHTPHEPHRQVILRICHPEDEDDTKNDYIYPYMQGEERWLWLNSNKIFPLYIDCNNGSKSRMFSEEMITTDPYTAGNAHYLTRYCYYYYEQFLGKNLTGDNLKHYQNATQSQYNALVAFKEEKNIYHYILFLEDAIQKYQKITL